MKRILLVSAMLALTACGTTKGDRAMSGGLIGAGVGLVSGGVGVLVGALLGGGTGYLVAPEDLNLGTPLWRQ